MLELYILKTKIKRECLGGYMLHSEFCWSACPSLIWIQSSRWLMISIQVWAGWGEVVQQIKLSLTYDSLAKKGGQLFSASTWPLKNIPWKSFLGGFFKSRMFKKQENKRRIRESETVETGQVLLSHFPLEGALGGMWAPVLAIPAKAPMMRGHTAHICPLVQT